MQRIPVIALLILLFAGFSGCTKQSAMEVNNLTCEYLTNPLGIDAERPQISWQLK
jgi:alpha-L-rhamnosidase